MKPAPPEVFRHSAHAERNRRVKALELAKHVYANPVPWPVHDAGKRALERSAGVRRCSSETWDLAVELLEQKHAWDRAHGVASPQAPPPVRAVRVDRACEHWDHDHVCGAPGARLYTTGLCCPLHTPAALKGRPETVPDPTLTLRALRIAAGRDPNEAAPLSASLLNDDRAIASGKRRATHQRIKEAKRRLQSRTPN